MNMNTVSESDKHNIALSEFSVESKKSVKCDADGHNLKADGCDDTLALEWRVKGNNLMREGTDIAAAVEAYTKAMEFANDSYILYNNRAAAHMMLGEYYDAVADCDASLLIKENPKAYCRRAQALAKLKIFDEAFDAIEKALEINPNDSECLKVMQALNNSCEGYEKEEEVEQLRRNGNSRMRAKDYTGAVAAYTKAIQIYQSNHILYNNRAAAHLLNSDYHSAIADCDASLAIQHNTKAYCRKAKALRHLGMLDEAIQLVNRALELNPNDSESLGIEKELLSDQHKYDNDVMSFYDIQERAAQDIVKECML